jgi:hypothetical protein
MDALENLSAALDMTEKALDSSKRTDPELADKLKRRAVKETWTPWNMDALENLSAALDMTEKARDSSKRTDEPTVEDLCKEIAERRRTKYANRTKPYPRNNPIASDISDCVRETVLGITQWKERPDFPIAAVERMERGNQIEDLTLRELMELGYSVRVDRQPFELRDKKGRLISRGRVDAFIKVGRKEYPLECKSMNPNIYSRIDTQEDFDSYSFFRKYPRQLQSYLLANNFEEGFWLIDDCMGHWKLIPCRLDYDRAEKILKHTEQAVEHIAAGTLPGYHTDPSYCLKCWAFKRVCTPPFFSGEGMKAINDPELADKLKRRAELDAAASEYDRLDKDVKETLKEAMKPTDVFIIGDFMITAEEKERRYKAQPAKPAHTTTFLGLEIEKISEEAAIEKSDADYNARS